MLLHKGKVKQIHVKYEYNTLALNLTQNLQIFHKIQSTQHFP